MKKRTKVFLIVLGVVAALIAALNIRNALLPEYDEVSGGKVIVNGAEYHFDGRFSLDGHGAVIGKLKDSGEKVCRVDDGGYFLYVRSKPFTMLYNPLVREDAVEAYLSGVSRLVMGLGSEKTAETEDEQVIDDFVRAIISEDGHIKLERDDVIKHVKTTSDAFPTVHMGFDVIVRGGKYYAETELLYEEGSAYAYRMFAPLGESASRWLDENING